MIRKNTSLYWEIVENLVMNREVFKSQCLTLLFCAFAALFFLSAKAPYIPTDEELDYAQLANTITEVKAPYLKGNCVVFTQEKNARHIGISFDFENFGTIHSFKKRVLLDDDLNEADSLYFYILNLPDEVQSFEYRIVIDGLWTTDPMNERKVYNREARITLSYFDASREIPSITQMQNDGFVHFVYMGKTGQEVRLGGSFTNWDSWIYKMQEVAPGFYELSLPLPPGKYEYAYFTGITSFIDETNPERCYTLDGKKASLLIVN